MATATAVRVNVKRGTTWKLDLGALRVQEGDSIPASSAAPALQALSQRALRMMATVPPSRHSLLPVASSASLPLRHDDEGACTRSVVQEIDELRQVVRNLAASSS